MGRRTVEPLEKLLLIFLADRADMDDMASLAGIHDFSSASMPDVRQAIIGLHRQGLIDGETSGAIRVLCPPDEWELPVGEIPASLRKELIEEAGACVACGSTERLCIDHIHPRSRGGTNDRDNLQVLCAPCNSSKGSKLPEEWKGRCQ